MTRRVRALFVALLSGAAFPALAHHGQDFLLVESPTVPHPGDAYLLADLGVPLGDAEEQAGFEPALLLGLAERVALEVHAHTEKPTGEGWRYEATAPSLHVLFTDPEREDGFKAGLSAEYELASERGAPDNLEVRLGLEQGNAQRKVGANLLYHREQGQAGHVGAVLGTHWKLAPRFALGAEGMADFDRAAGAQLLASAHWECDERWSLKFGLGGEREEHRGWVPLARLGLVLRLRD